MVGKTKNPKELLSDHELIGFTRRSQGGSQMAHRASSAKVGPEPAGPAKGQAPARATEKSDT